MSGTPGPFEIFYASPIQHPVLLWVAAIAGLALLASRDVHPSVRRYCLLLGALSLTDAWLTTGAVFGIGPLEGAAASLVPLFFVLAGDLRYLLLVTNGDADGVVRFDRRGVLTAIGLTLIVPIGSQLALRALPADLQGPRTMFFIYEVMFVLLTLSLLRLRPRLRDNAWVGGISRFVILYYTLWASADFIILTTGSDLAHGLRVVPNLLYYGGLIGAIAWLAPARND